MRGRRRFQAAVTAWWNAPVDHRGDAAAAQELGGRLLDLIQQALVDASDGGADRRAVPAAAGPPPPRPPDAPAATRIFLRPLANPLSLGFLGLFFATMLLSGLELGWVPPSQGHILAIGILVFTIPAQIIACVYGFLVRDMVAATGMGVLSGTWAATGVVLLLSKPGTTSSGLALILVIGAAAACIPAVPGADTKAVSAAVMLTTSFRWAVTAGYEFSHATVWKTAAGAAGLLLGALAAYGALAFELEDQRRKTVLPTLRRKSGRTAITGDLASQVSEAANEAGVRKQL